MFLFLGFARKLENKLVAVKVELRPWALNLNLEDLHKNRELPGAFMCFLGVADSSLPTKGTAHRTVRGSPEIDQKNVNQFLDTISILVVKTK